LGVITLSLACGGASSEDAESQQGRGFVLAATAPFDVEGIAAQLDSMAAAGANAIAVPVRPLPSSAAGAAMNWPTTAFPIDDAEAIVTIAQARGLAATLIAEASFGSDSSSTSEGPVWTRDYAGFLVQVAKVGASRDVAQVGFGIRPMGVASDADFWRSLAKDIRAEFQGEVFLITGIAEAESITFWDAFDHIGISSNFPVGESRESGRLLMLLAWKASMGRIVALSERTSRRVILTRMGCRSVDGGATRDSVPSDAGHVDLPEQAAYYWAALQACTEAPWIAGLFWWHWPAGGTGGLTDSGFSPLGKPALAEVISVWSAWAGSLEADG
jgi:hypothetical protein